MLKYIRLMVLVFIFTGCVPPTLNPIDPELDSPIIIGDTTNVPWGCTLWKASGKKQQKCCDLEAIVPTEEDPSIGGGWVLTGWDC